MHRFDVEYFPRETNVELGKFAFGPERTRGIESSRESCRRQRRIPIDIREHHMGSIDLIKACLDSIRQMSDEISGSILYVDAGCLEAFEFFGAFSLLLELGAHAVLSLENASSACTVADRNYLSKESAKKIVIFTSRLLSDVHRYILHCLRVHQTVLHCSIYTSISETAHAAYIGSPLGPDAFREYETLLFQDYEELVRKTKGIDVQNQSHQANDSEETKSPRDKLVPEADWSDMAWGDVEIPTPSSASIGKDVDDIDSFRCAEMVISVHHFPMIFCPISPRTFVLPLEGAISEASLSNKHEHTLSLRLPPLITGLMFDGDDTPPGAILTAHFLYHLAANMDLKMEIFSLGDVSKTIGKILTDMSSLYDVGRRNKRSAGLLLIDRSVDLITPCSHGDSLVDRILSSLPRRKKILLQNPNRSSIPNKVQWEPLGVQIPFQRVFCEEPVKLLEDVKAFMSGWNSIDSDKEMVDGKNQMHFDTSLLNGSLVSTDNHQGALHLEALLDRNIKDGALLIKKWLQEALRSEKLALNLKSRPGVVTPLELRSMVKMLCSNETSLLRNKGIIQLALAAEVALGEPQSSRWDAFVSAERILRLSAEDTSQNLSGYIRDLVVKSSLIRSDTSNNKVGSPQRGLLSFEDALMLAIIGYLLAGDSFVTSGSGGTFSWEEEHLLKEAIVNAIIENPPATKLRFLNGLEEEFQAIVKKNAKDVSSTKSASVDFDDQWDSWGDEDVEPDDDQAYGDIQLRLELRDRVDQVLKFFHKLSSSKGRNPVFKEGASFLGSSFVGDSSRSLLSKLLTMILGDYDVPGLAYHSSVVGRFLKSGFGRFGLGQAKPKLGEQDVLLVFLVGGINSLEVREVQDAVAASGRPDIELILGGTTLVTPDDMFDMLMGSSSCM